MIEDSKGKASTFKGLKRKKTAPGYKGKDQKGKYNCFKGTCYICNKEGHKANECRSRLKQNKNLVDGLFKDNVAMVDKKSVYLYPKLINKGKIFCLFA